MAIKYKQKCSRCKEKYVIVTRRTRFINCYDCQKQEMAGPIDDPKMKRMFKIPEKFYKENGFLRSIKVNYIKFGSLSEKQLEAFKKVVKDLKAEAKKE